MGARLRIFLTKEQDKTLLKLRTANVPQKVKDRALVVRLNAQGWYVEKIAAHFNWIPQTVREVLHKWQKLGMESFSELSGRGGGNGARVRIFAFSIPTQIGLYRVSSLPMQDYHGNQIPASVS